MDETSSSKSERCSKCGKEFLGIASFMITSSGDGITAKCVHCMAEEAANSFVSLEDADEHINEVSGSIRSLENIISKCPEMPEVPQSLSACAMTPLSMYITLQIYLAAYKSRRMQMFTETGSRARIAYAIKKAVKEEDYELAARLKSLFET